MNLQPLLNPKSIALVGASAKLGSLGYEMMRMIEKGEYQGEVYPINPGYEEVCGYKCYPNLASIGQPVDVVVLSIAARRVLATAEEALDLGAKSLVVFANCVLEEDPDLEDKLIALCEKRGVPLLGHNSMGYYNNDIGLRVCGFDAPDENITGNISFISQSGSAFSTIGHNETQLKFNFMLATGTGQVTSLADYMHFALEMETTKVLGLYMESVRKPQRFVEALELAAKKGIPIVAMKVGKSELGAQFALSHTGGLAGDDDAIQAVFDHYGVIRVDSLDELANTLALFSYWPEYRKAGKLVAIADSGGERNLIADAAEDVGLEFAELSHETMDKLASIQEYGQDAANPLDPWGTGIDFEKIFAESMAIMLADPAAGIGVISQDLRDGYYLSEGCVEALHYGHRETGKPVAFITNFGGIRRSEITGKINDLKIPVLVGTQAALKSIKNFEGYLNFSYEKRALPSLEPSQWALKLLKSHTTLKEAYSLEIFRELGMPMTESHLVESLEELEALELTFPVVLKTAVDGIYHKADVQGVKVNLKNLEELKKAYQDMASRLGNQCLVQPMSGFDVELILGMKEDPIFGPLMIVGAGGIFTELLRDRFVLLPQASRREVEEGLSKLKIAPLLDGFRGTEPVDRKKLVDVILGFADLIQVLSPYVSEMDLNPLVLRKDQMTGLDALIVTKH